MVYIIKSPAFIATFAAAVLLQPCSASPASPLNDLRLLRVDVVSQEQIPNQDKYWSPGTITASLIRVSFTTTAALEKTAKDEHYNIDNVISICRDSEVDHSRELRGFPTVYDAAGPIDGFRQADGASAKNGAFEYHVYFDVRQSGIHGFYPFDLARAPSDICITVNGAQESGAWITNRLASNTLVIPKDVIARAIAAAR